MVTHRSDPSATVRALRGAAPYVRLYKGKVFVIKAGGAVFSDPVGTHSLIQQIGILHNLGIKVVLVHGGGPQLDQMQRSLGIEPRMVKGRRVTDARSIDVTTMVLNGLLNTRILAICRQLGVDAIGISGVDAGLIRARRRPPVDVDGESVDYGFVGDVLAVDPSVITRQLEAGLMPVVSPLSADDDGCVLNINADTVAARLGAALGAEKLILCTGAPGILEDVRDPGSLVSYTDLGGLKRLEAAGSFADGMLPKATAIEGAIRGGVRRVHVISYKAADSVLAEVFTNEGTGTLIVEDIGALTPAEQNPAGMGP
ncbi:MAG: acetylglutamate kinase [Steroidobacteraceae bacterium]|jgi:acetylglutamate kinase|nr:acetylglutamate kinase [Steroidobacteraceae bacterium]